MSRNPTEAPRWRTTWSLPVLIPGLIVLGVLLVVCSFNPKGAERFFAAGQAWVAASFAWFYLRSVAVFFIVLIVNELIFFFFF